MKRKATPLQRAAKHVAAMQRLYDKAERALISAALVGCVRRDPTVADQREASSSGRDVDVSHEVADLRWERNALTDAERELAKAKRKGGRG